MSAHLPEHPLVRVRDGALAGTRGQGVLAFLGVPYAAPPVGDLRFAPPRPPAPWDGERPAVAAGAPPLQPRPVTSTTAPAEDCLTLNVWAPEDPGPHPVLVHLHGGGNYLGHSTAPGSVGPAYARDGIVYVTIGYRLGVFGFLELGSVLGEPFRGSGNNGLRDVLAGLDWVSQNIAAFGGDPARVTLAGHSSGGFNVSTLLGSPHLHGRARAVLAQSGGGHAVFRLDEADEAAAQFVAALRAAGHGPEALPHLNAGTLTGIQNSNFGHGVVDGDVLEDLPYLAAAAGVNRDITLLIGAARDEMVGLGGAYPLTDYDAPTRDLWDRVRPLLDATDDDDALLELISYLRHGASSLLLGDAHAQAGGTTYAYRWLLPDESGPSAGFARHGAEQPYVRGERPGPVADAVRGHWTRFVHDARPGEDWPAWRPEENRYLQVTAHAEGLTQIRRYPPELLAAWRAAQDHIRPRPRFGGAWLPPHRPGATVSR